MNKIVLKEQKFKKQKTDKKKSDDLSLLPKNKLQETTIQNIENKTIKKQIKKTQDDKKIQDNNIENKKINNDQTARKDKDIVKDNKDKEDQDVILDLDQEQVKQQEDEDLPEEIKKKLEKQKAERLKQNKKRKRKKLLKTSQKIRSGLAYIKASFNNTIVTLTDLSGNVISTASAGMAGFKGPKKSTPYAAQIVTKIAVTKAKEEFGLEEVRVFLKGIGPGRESSVRALNANGLIVTFIKDITPMPHNGCRRKKPRRT